MKVLFICDKYYPLEKAAANCVHKVINELTENDIECDVLNITNKFSLPDVIKEKKYNIIQAYSVSDVGLKSEDFRRFNVLRKIECILIKFTNKITKNPIQFYKVNLIKKHLKKYGKDYDVFIPIVANFNSGMACMQYCNKNNKPYILYQVDPIGSNEVFRHKKAYLCKFEKKLYKSAECVMTTPILVKEKEKEDFYQKTKMVSTQFPNIRNLISQNIKHGEEIVCFFCGYIYSGIRDCSYTLDLFSRITDENVCLKFAGTGQENVIAEYAETKLKNRIRHIGQISMDDSIVNMQQADFLINIGNTMSNQVPSKLFDYISTGKPIINICKNKNCPTIPYLEKYKRAINIVESDSEKEKDVQAKRLYEFINAYLNSECKYEQIEEMFKENTSKYVGQQFINELKKIKL